jgi:hypothetical protein
MEKMQLIDEVTKKQELGCFDIESLVLFEEKKSSYSYNAY